MFNYGGDNNFGDRFDFYEWSAPYYESSKEVYLALKALNLNGKTLKAINVIGECGNIYKEDKGYLYSTINAAGIELGELWWEKYEHIDDVLVPWEVGACEPLQLVFDDMTLEFLPIDAGGARIGVNTVSEGLVNGINNSDLNSNGLFKEFIGAKLENVRLYIDKKEKIYVDSFSINSKNPYSEKDTNYIVCFCFCSGDCQLELNIVQRYSAASYKIKAKICNYHPNSDKVPYRRFISAFIPQEQISICNGRGYGGTFWITGTNLKEENNSSIPLLSCFGISIDEMHIGEFLYEFLTKYYDHSLQEREEYEREEFDWYGVNLYTLESMKSMLSDIKQTITMLKEDFNNPYLENIKSHFPWYLYTNKMKEELTEKEIKELTKKAVPLAIDFYERFCSRIENMLKIPGREVISFAGP